MLKSTFKLRIFFTNSNLKSRNAQFYKSVQTLSTHNTSKSHFRNLTFDNELTFGIFPNEVDADARSPLFQVKGFILDDKEAQIGNDFLDAAYAGERQSTIFKQFGLTFLIGMRHGDDDIRGAGYQVHSAHAFHHFAGGTIQEAMLPC